MNQERAYISENVREVLENDTTREKLYEIVNSPDNKQEKVEVGGKTFRIFPGHPKLKITSRKAS